MFYFSIGARAGQSRFAKLERLFRAIVLGEARATGAMNSVGEEGTLLAGMMGAATTPTTAKHRSFASLRPRHLVLYLKVVDRSNGARHKHNACCHAISNHEVVGREVRSLND